MNSNLIKKVVGKMKNEKVLMLLVSALCYAFLAFVGVFCLLHADEMTGIQMALMMFTLVIAATGVPEVSRWVFASVVIE